MNAMRGGAKTGWTAGLCPEPHGIRIFWNLCDHGQVLVRRPVFSAVILQTPKLSRIRHGAFWSSSCLFRTLNQDGVWTEGQRSKRVQSSNNLKSVYGS